MDRGDLRFNDRIAGYVPKFTRRGKDEITLYDVLTHQGGFLAPASMNRSTASGSIRQAI